MVLMVVSAVVVATWWRFSLNVVNGGGFGATAGVRVGQTYYVDAAVGPQSGTGVYSVVVDVDSAEAVAVVETTSGGGFTVTGVELKTVVCVRNSNPVGLGVSPASALAGSCSSVYPLIPGQTLNLGLTTTEILYQVVIATPGIYRIDGSVINYHQGLRQGTAMGTTAVTLTATP